MKVLFFCNLLPRKTGAFERFLVELATKFRQNDDALAFAFAGEPVPQVADAFKSVGAEWDVIEGWSDGFNEHTWRFCVPALKLLRKHRPDVAAVHFGNELPSLVVSLLAPVCGCRRLRWVWQQDQQISTSTRLTARVSRLRMLAMRFDRFVTVYEGGRKSLLARGIPAGRTSVIFNSVADCRSKRDSGWFRKELGLQDGAVLLATVGSLVSRKRHDFLLRAMERLPAGTHLAIIGDGPLKDSLERRRVETGLVDRVHMIGLRDDVREILPDVDIYVHTSTAETCTYATTESMCAGRPAVVTEAGAAREQIADGISGYVLNADNMEGFVARVRELGVDPARREAMGREARRRWSEHFRVETQAANYHAMYRSLMEP